MNTVYTMMNPSGSGKELKFYYTCGLFLAECCFDQCKTELIFLTILKAILLLLIFFTLPGRSTLIKLSKTNNKILQFER